MTLFKVYKNDCGKFSAFLKVNKRIEYITQDYSSRKACLKAILEIKSKPNTIGVFGNFQIFSSKTISDKKRELFNIEVMGATIDPELYIL